MLLEYNSLQGSLWSASDPIYDFSTDPSNFHNPSWTLYPAIYGNLHSIYFIPSNTCSNLAKTPYS